MIRENKLVFQLDTPKTSYILRITREGHPEHIYYGKRLPQADTEALRMKNTITLGGSVDYASGYCLDNLLLEYSGIGKGDYRHSPLEIQLPDGSFTTDFVYQGHEIAEAICENNAGLPFAKGKGKSLILTLADKKYKALCLQLVYTVLEGCDVILRHAQLINGTAEAVRIRKFLSAMVDLPEAEYSLVTLNGNAVPEIG